MKKEMRRLEILTPEAGNQFIPAQYIGSSENIPKGYNFLFRLEGGHSFLSGFTDTIYFDGFFRLGVKIIRTGLVEYAPDVLLSKIMDHLKLVLPNQQLSWNTATQSFEIGLLESCQISINESSIKVIQQIEEGFGIHPNALLAQNNWAILEK